MKQTCAQVLQSAGCKYERYRFYYAGHLWCLVSNALEKMRDELKEAGLPMPKSYLGYLIFSSSKVWREKQIAIWEKTINECSAEWKPGAHVWEVKRIAK